MNLNSTTQAQCLLPNVGCHLLLIVEEEGRNQVIFKVETVSSCPEVYRRPTRRSAVEDGAALSSARRRKARTFPELCGPHSHLVVLAAETGGHWSEEAHSFLSQLANAKARSVPPHPAWSRSPGLAAQVVVDARLCGFPCIRPVPVGNVKNVFEINVFSKKKGTSCHEERWLGTPPPIPDSFVPANLSAWMDDRHAEFFAAISGPQPEAQFHDGRVRRRLHQLTSARTSGGS